MCECRIISFGLKSPKVARISNHYCHPEIALWLRYRYGCVCNSLERSLTGASALSCHLNLGEFNIIPFFDFKLIKWLSGRVSYTEVDHISMLSNNSKELKVLWLLEVRERIGYRIGIRRE